MIFNQNQNERICRPLMTFTRVFRSVNEERKTMHGFQIPNNRKLSNNSEEGYEIQTVRCFFFKKKTDIQARKKKD
jgi:hypothetical protein